MILPAQLRLDLAQHIRVSSWVGIPAAPMADFICDFLEKYEHPSFSATLETLNNPKEPFRYQMRSDAVWTMQMLAHHGPGTMLWISNCKIESGLSPKYAKDMTRHIGELRYWGLVKDTGTRAGGCIIWELTQTGHDFIAGKCQVPSAIYVLNKKRVDPPDGKANGDMIFVHEIPAQDYSQYQHDWLRKASKPVAQYVPNPA